MNNVLAYFAADIHLDNFARHGGPMRAGLNARARAVLRSVELVVNSTNGSHLFLLGDIFHTSRPSPALLANLQRVLSPTRTRYATQQVHALIGNHDQESAEALNNALSPLAPVCNVIDKPRMIAVGQHSVLAIPFTPGSPKEWLPGLLTKFKHLHAVCFHAGISDSGTPYYLDNTAGSINVDVLAQILRDSKLDVRVVLAGDWHRHQMWTRDGTTICQVGSLCPSRFPPNYEHGDRGPLVAWHDDMTLSVQDVPGPRFFKHRWSELVLRDALDWTPDEDVARPAFVRVECRRDQVDEAEAWAESLRVRGALLVKGYKQPGAPDTNTFVEVVVDRGVEQAKTRAASFEARQASSFEEALANYVQRMPVDSGVSKPAVLQHVRRLLA